MSQQKLTIGLFGFGVVGEGIYQVLHELPSLGATVRRICIRDPHKPRNAPAELFTTRADELLNDPEINLIVELIDDAEAAYAIVTRALRSGRHVVSANKALLARHLPELLYLQQEYGGSLLYEAAVCGSIPILRNLEEYYDNDLLQGISGIVNGSTNYILTQQAKGLDYDAALRQAQQLGFAESNPTLDVEGHDAANKLSLLLAHAWGIVVQPHNLLRQGITRIRPEDWDYAREKGWRIVLAATALRNADGSVSASVLPRFVAPGNPLFDVRDEYNGLLLRSRLSDRQFLSGKGAGRFPTASAVVSDISARSYQYKYEYKKLRRSETAQLAPDFELEVYVGFDADNPVPESDFGEVYSSYRSEEGAYFTGRISARALLAAAWWQAPGVSVIALPEGAPASRRPAPVRKAALALAV
ncbi:homoserine dehydrogenase [Flaviaesturariibacter flavus]|uniref:Homoserine dehydrogenase n=1 Tax=Flaviaesturariibacter flavus TaxID=2502780 RepID=A0A4R1BK22_9BACT|nr:homoserine dehydrogenase [Flaviaesturariibacter flavus]TCJ17664.1 homoserine dehydrogenase [Flaviaesturariibacter flavus]